MTYDENPDRAPSPNSGPNSRSDAVVNGRSLLDSLININERNLTEFQELNGIRLDPGDVRIIAYAITYEGHVSLKRGEFDRALEVFIGLEMFCRGIEFDWGLDLALNAQGVIYFVRNHLEEALEVFDLLVAFHRSRGNTESVQAALNAIAMILIYKTNDGKAPADKIIKMQTLPGFGATIQMTFKDLKECDEEPRLND